MTFHVLQKDGMGKTLATSGLKNTISQAKRLLRSKNMRYFAVEKSEGFDGYFFDGDKADLDYWVKALKLDSGKVKEHPIPK